MGQDLLVEQGALDTLGTEQMLTLMQPRQRLDAVWRSRLEAIEVICGIAATASPAGPLSVPSLNVSLLESQVLPSSISFEAPDGVYSSPSRSESNLVRVRAAIDAKLLVYLGCELRPKRDKAAFLRWQKTVFHLSTYRGLPEFSPFTADEEVVWTLVAALMMIMVIWSWEWQRYDPDDASEIAEIHRGIRVGPEAVRRGTQRGWHERSERDWAGLEGLWTGYAVCSFGASPLTRFQDVHLCRPQRLYRVQPAGHCHRG